MKKEIRNKMRLKRLSLSKSEFWDLNDKILERIKSIDWSVYQCVHIFLPIKENNEVDTFEILSFFKYQYPNLKIVIPRTNFKESKLENVVFDHYQTVLCKNEYHIPEPVYGHLIQSDLIDVVFVPLLAFDEDGNRIGYGGGFYDRFLSTCKEDVLKIGLSLFPPLEEKLVTDEFDIPLNQCITPERHYFFSNKKL